MKITIHKLLLFTVMIQISIYAAENDFVLQKKILTVNITIPSPGIIGFDYNVKRIQNLIKLNKNKLYTENNAYKEKWNIGIFSVIARNLINKWAEDKIIADFYNYWISELKLHIPQDYIYSPAILSAFIWNIRIDAKDKIKKLPKILIPELEKAKEQYLQSNKINFLKWLLKQKPKNILSCSYNQNYCNLLISTALTNNKLDILIDTLLLKSKIIRHNKCNNIIDESVYELNPISNIAKYSEVSGKVSDVSKKAIVHFYNIYAQHPNGISQLSKTIRGKCIIDVVKKYDLLNGKPKDGYYYPVNDMKIKVESD